MKHLLIFLISLAAFAETTPTDTYLALTATLLEHRIIGDEHLLRIIGSDLNPISELETKTNSQKLIAHKAYTNVLKNKLNTTQIAPWAKEHLSQEAKEREEKKEKQEESKYPWVNNYIYSIAAGDNHTCAIQKNSRKVICWGDNQAKQLEVPEDLRPVKALYAGPQHTCAILTDHTVKCWGANDDQDILKPPKDLDSVEHLYVGPMYTCARKFDQSRSCWGNVSTAQLRLLESLKYAIYVSESDRTAGYFADKNLLIISKNAPFLISIRGGFQQYFFNESDLKNSVSIYFSKPNRDDYDSNVFYCTKKNNNSLECIGLGLKCSHQSPEGNIPGYCLIEHVKSASVSTYGGVCALKKDNSIKCFKATTPDIESDCDAIPTVYQNCFKRNIQASSSSFCNYLEHIGTSCTSQRYPQYSFIHFYTSITLGNKHACAVQTNGTVECQGDNSLGQLNVPANLSVETGKP